MESKLNETFGIVIFQPNVIQETWSASQKSHEAVTRVEGAPRGWGAPPTLWAPRSSPDLIRPPIYTLIPKNIQESHVITFPPSQPYVPMRSHPGAFSGILLEGDSITEGIYINTIASPMKRE